MPAIDFPSSPSNGQTYSVGNVTYTYNSSKGVWNITSNGIQGTQGTQGVQGLNGLYAGQGTQGTQGIQGVQGVQGTQGLQGLSGQAVYQGNQGTQGTQGPQGTQGVQGLNGLYAGQGTQGTQGVQGVIGTTGATGTAWSIRVSTSDTTTSLSWNSSLYDMYVLTAQSGPLVISLDSASSPVHGQKNIFRIKTSNSGYLGFASGTKGFRAIGITLPSFTTAGNVMYISCIYNATESRWDIIGIREGSA